MFVVNQSPKAINLSFNVENQLKELKQKHFIKLRPKKDFVVNPRERKEIILIFKPEHRLHSFKKEIYYKIVDNNEQKKLLNLSGACHGIELKLMEDTVGFGAVVIGSKVSKQLQLTNLGDIGAKFRWETELCANYFTITPVSGTCPAHEDIFFEVTFHPDVVDNDIRFNKVKCNILNSDALYLNLLGKCIDQPQDQIQEINFETLVRTPSSKKVSIKNPTNKPWRVKVTLTPVQTQPIPSPEKKQKEAVPASQFKEYFQGKEYVEVPANSSADYEVIYKPLTMTRNDKAPSIKEETHEGQLFFPLPDGQAIVYNLIGKSLPPNVEQTFDIQLKAKKNQIQILPIRNWLKTSQRFNIQWNLEPEDPSVILYGANTVDVMGEGHKDYKLTLFALKPTQNKPTIYFRNQATNEFIFFRIVSLLYFFISLFLYCRTSWSSRLTPFPRSR